MYGVQKWDATLLCQCLLLSRRGPTHNGCAYKSINHVATWFQIWFMLYIPWFAIYFGLNIVKVAGDSRISCTHGGSGGNQVNFTAWTQLVVTSISCISLYSSLVLFILFFKSLKMHCNLLNTKGVCSWHLAVSAAKWYISSYANNA